jgi:uncharacterized cupredoxin-like copper-binding protein
VSAPAANAQTDAHGHAHTAPKASTKTTPFGRAGDPAKVQRTIDIRMSDTMRFAPAALTIRRGETVRLLVANDGKLMHELVLGTEPALRKHAQQMRDNPNMAHHDEVNAVHVPPGAKGELVWTFDRPGQFGYACLVPGHSEAGMVGTVTVK